MPADVLWLVLVVLALLAVLANALSLFQGAFLRGRVRRAMRTTYGAYLPRVAILLPVRGLDEGFDANLRAILSQTYPTYRIVVIADDPADPALEAVRGVARELPQVPMAELVSDPAGPGGKVNALRTGLGQLTPDDEVVVFADADIRPATDWLRQLVQPLADLTVGVATGFRWYVPPRPTFWSLVRAEWNGVSANVLFDPRRAFAWGGSSAVRTEILPALRLEDRWREVLSDDLVLTQAVRSSGRRIAYVPMALVPTFEGCDRQACLEWCFRQMMMATLYQPHLRKYAARAFAVFNGAAVLGVVSLDLAAFVSISFLLPAALLLVTVPATAAKASIRRRALFLGAPSVAEAWHVPSWRTFLASLAVPWIMAAGLIRTRRMTRILWRGRKYDVSDPYRIRLLPEG